MRTIAMLIIFCAMFCDTSVAADVVPSDVTGTALATLEDSTLVDYNVVEFEMPELGGGRVLTAAYLEFYMDVSSTLADSLSHGLATIEVTLMPTLVNGKLDTSATPSIAQRTVRVGSDRTVRVYITDLLLEGIGELESPVVFLVGAITGGRYGRFEAQPVPGAAGGAKAVLSVHSQAPYQAEATVDVE